VRQQVESGELSTLAYHMIARRFAPKLLAQYLGMWTFQVKRHLKPATFAKLSREVHERYASFFNMTVEELRSLPDPAAPLHFFRGAVFKT
jgi:hypothetical protein